MKLLGFYIGGHDSNIAMVDDRGEVKYYKLERLIQAKHKKGNLDWIKSVCDEKEFKPDIICFSDGNRNSLGICDEGQLWQKCKPLDIFPDSETYCIDHHYAHILSAFPVVNDTASYGVCVDGRGDHQIKCSIISEPYNIRKSRFVYASADDAFCLLFNEIGKFMHLSGGELDFAGKIMGAHSYGCIDEMYKQQCSVYAEKNGVNSILKLQYHGVDIAEICNEMDQRFFDWLASYHSWVGETIEKILSNYIRKNDKVIYSGGGAQNTVFNHFLSKKYKMYIPPHCYDGGLSLGCVKLLADLVGEKIVIKDFPFCSGDDDLGYASRDTVDRVVDLLCKGKIVGWCQGKSEIGPRALGHRSILMNPSLNNGKDIINERVKKREKWRPFAASILKEDVENVTGRKESLNYMLQAVEVLPEYREVLKSVVHIDGTCRFQTVEDSDCLHSFCQLITKFKAKTGVYGVLNTSYNVAGMPIANSKEDIVKAFDSLDLDALCIGDEIFLRE